MEKIAKSTAGKATLLIGVIMLNLGQVSFSQTLQGNELVAQEHPVEQLYAVINSGVTTLEWQVKKETNWYECAIERSTDGVHFTTIGYKQGIPSSNDMKYVWVDHHPTKGSNYYRIKKIHQDDFSLSASAEVENKDSINLQLQPEDQFTQIALNSRVKLYATNYEKTR